VFKQLNKLGYEDRHRFLAASLLHAKVQPKDLVEWLNQKNPPLVQYSLLLARIKRDPSLIPVIEKNLAAYDDHLLLIALKTLSILYGREIRLNDWWLYKKDHRFPSDYTYLETDCSKFKPESLDSIQSQDTPILNACVWSKVNSTYFLGEVEISGWFELPFYSQQEATLKTAFQIGRTKKGSH
jgi:hypothetical protein